MTGKSITLFSISDDGYIEGAENIGVRNCTLGAFYFVAAACCTVVQFKGATKGEMVEKLRSHGENNYH